MKRENKSGSNSKLSSELLSEITVLIEESKKRTAIAINSEITRLYWSIGKAIEKFLLKEKRAGYGEKIVATLSQQLSHTYGKGYAVSSLSRMINFYKFYPRDKIIATVSQQLSWSHFVELIAIEDTMKRDFYMEQAMKEGWSIRGLREKVDNMLFERTAISRKPEKLLKQELRRFKKEGAVTPDLVFRDPYLLNFLGLKDTYSETDLESAILNQLQEFLSELGTDFAFIARQKRIVIGHEDFRIDLLFFRRGLKRLVAIDLKLDRFKAAYKGQMELYLKLIGLVCKNAIMLVDFTNHRKAAGETTFKALIQANHARLRPILMTTIAMVFGMLPIAIASGAGAEWKNGLAWVIIGGLISSLVLTLIIVPVIYTIFDGWIERSKRKKQQKKTIEELMTEIYIPAESKDGFTAVHVV